MLPPFNSEALVLGAQAARAFIQTHRIAYAQITPDLKIGLASDNLHALLAEPAGLSQHRSLSECLDEFVGAEDILHAILTGAEPSYSLEHVNRDLPDGSIMYLNFRILPLDEHNPSDGLLLVIEDVSDFDRLKQAIVQDRNELRLAKVALENANQELESLNRFKSFMLSMAAHDLRNAFNVIMIYSGILRGDPKPDNPHLHRHSLDMIDSEVEWLGMLFNNLLSMDQIEKARLPIQFSKCNLSALLQNILANLEILASVGELQINFKVDQEPFTIEADPERIKQVANNLVGNAIKYTPKGGRVEISLRQTGGRAELKVSDTGKGMNAAQIDHLFHPYYRTNEAEKSTIPGSGLGLFIARTLVEAHHGTIEVASQVGQGTTFTVYLPLRQPREI
ncbi:MAG TPA: HAMP domain-containing sensor histidine kinase [Anaerolineales bacterium]|nr:HAMP domain-containing sensor histidine kinase [Anaerolineales bacterium]